MASFTSNIPLHCSICPKGPTFSDVSHLLTHIASKGHLSHYYKVQIRSASEEDARQQLDAYNTWYTEWGIEHLMSDRMNLKDKRRTRTRSANARRQAENAPQDALRRKVMSANTLDPRLAEHLVKNEPTPSPSPRFLARPYPSFPIGSQQNVWPSPHSTLSNPGLIDGSDVFTEKSESYSRAATPLMTRPTATDKDKHGEDVFDATIVSEASKLKGVYWPGMDIFDSATPEMKRKRNQKKDISVVEQLELNSREVEAMEHIWTPCGTLHKERPISGSITDSSPVKLDASPTRDFRDRPPLLELPPNIRSSSRQQRNRRRSPRKRNDNDLILEDELDLQRALHQTRVEPERKMAPTRKRKRAFEVLRDGEDEAFGRPMSMSTLTSEFHPRPSQKRSRSQAQLTPQQPPQPLGQHQQQLDQHQHHTSQAFPQQDFLHGFDLQQTMNPFQSTFDTFGLNLSYHPTTSYFDNSLQYSAHPFQPFQPFQHQADLSGILGGGITTNNSWLGNNATGLLNSNTAFDVEGADLKAQLDEDDERTVTAPASPSD